MMQKIMMNLTLETCGNGFVPAVWCNCDKISFFFWPSHHLYVFTWLNNNI